MDEQYRETVAVFIITEKATKFEKIFHLVLTFWPSQKTSTLLINFALIELSKLFYIRWENSK